MPVLTVDKVIEAARRDGILDWLEDPEHHVPLLEAGFSKVERTSDQEFSVHLPAGPRTLVITYRIDAIDREHGGRRVRCTLDGRRTRGKLHYSLRTMKPSTTTLVTLHVDYSAGRLLGPLLDAFATRKALEAAMERMLDALEQHVPREEAQA